MTVRGGTSESAGQRVRANVGALLLVLGVLIAAGAVAGLVWHLVAPRTEYVFRDGVAQFTQTVPSTPVAADGWFAVIALVAGVLSGSLTQALLHRRIVGAVIGLALGTVFASLITWQVGHWFGSAEFEQAVRTAENATTVLAPLDVRAKGVLTLWPLAAMLTIFLGTFIDEMQRRFGRAHERERAAPPPPQELPPIREAGNHTSSYPYGGAAGEQGTSAP